MVNPYFRFKFKRFLRNARNTPQRVGNFFNENVFGGGKKQAKIRRFSAKWLVLVLVIFGLTGVQALVQERTVLVPVPRDGGTYREAVVGEFDNLNPIFALDGVNADVSKLIFAGLLEYAPDGQLFGELAETWTGNERADTFTVTLKPDLTWHDGEPLTAQDVAFTVDLIQNPDTRSPRRETWRGIETEVTDDKTIVFNLPNSFAPFPQLLTVGIVPQHLLEDIEPQSLRVSEFALNPVGSGPFVFDEYDVNQNRIITNAFDGYAQNTPRLNRFIIQSYESIDEARGALDQKLVDGLGSIDALGDYDSRQGFDELDPELTIGNYLFFNTNREPFKDAAVRRGMLQAINIQSVQESLDTQKPLLKSVFLDTQLRSIKSSPQPGYDVAKATKTLNDAGWKLDTVNQVLTKGDDSLQFELSIPERETQQVVARNIQNQLAQVGIQMEIETVAVENFQSDIALVGGYDAALISITNGIDPDVFVFWHSSQARVGGLNFSRISDSQLDESLEAGRTRTNRELREAKYEAFMERWNSLAPAVAINQEQYHYVRRDRVRGAIMETLPQPVNRFDSVEGWTVLFDNVERKNLNQ